MQFVSWLGELHRRFVWQVLLGYGVVAWVILQLVEALQGPLGLPLWFGPAALVVLLLGFPVFLITAVTQGRRDDPQAPFRDAGSGGDGSLGSWERLGGHPLQNAMDRVFTWRNAVAGGVVMATLLVAGSAGYLALRSAGVGTFGSLVAKGVLEPNEDLILSDFADRTSDGALGETVTALLRIDLSQSSSFHLLDPEDLSRSLGRMEKDPLVTVSQKVAMDLAQQKGVRVVVVGEVLPLGSGVVISARLMDASTGDTLASMEEPARTLDALPEAVHRLSDQLRERIGESLRSIHADQPPGAGRLGSDEAFPR